MCFKPKVLFFYPFLQVAKEGPEAVSIKDILLEMRTYRMGLIQVKIWRVVIEKAEAFFVLAFRNSVSRS